MRLADILTVERVTVRMRARDKPAALRELARLFVGADDGVAEEDIVRVFEEREALASTGVGSGVAIPHGRLRGVSRLRAALAVSAEGVEFDAIDGRPAHILIAVLGPEQKTGEHLKALARFSRLLRIERVRQRLMAADAAQDALEILLTEDAQR